MGAAAFRARKGCFSDETRGDQLVRFAAMRCERGDFAKRARKAIGCALDADIILHDAPEPRARGVSQVGAKLGA